MAEESFAAWLRERCDFWQRVLRVADWDVRLEVRSAEDLDGSWGRCLPSLPTKQARIQIHDPDDVDSVSERVAPYDAEEVLVHELLHLHSEPAWPTDGEDADDPKHVAAEQMMALTASALIKLQRRRA